MKYNMPISEKDFLKANKENKNLEEIMKEINDKYGVDAEYKKLELDRKELNNKADSEIESEVKKEYENEKNNYTSELEKKLNEIFKGLGGKKEEASEKAEKLKGAIENLYSERKEDAENDALKRGLGRSSIISNKIENFDREKVDNTVDVEKDYSKKVMEIDDEIRGLSLQKQEALKNYEITSALKIDEKIQSLKKIRDTENNKVIEYNNKMEQEEIEYNNSMQSKFDEYEHSEKLLGEHLSDDKKKEFMDEKVAAVWAYVKSVSPEESYKEMLNNKMLEKNLGVYYDYFLDHIKDKLKK